MRLIGNGGIRTLSPRLHEVWQFVEVDGRRVQKTKRIHGGKKEAKDALRELQQEMKARHESSDSFAAYAKSWLNWKRESSRHPSGTIRSYECAVNKMRFPDIPLQDITPQHCREMLIEATHGLSGTSSSFIHTICTMVFNSAVRDGLIASNPMTNIDKPKKDTEEREALSPDEMDALWEKLEGLPLDGRVMVLFFCLDAGLRIGEAMSLETKDVGDDVFKVSHSKTITRTLPMTERLKKKCRAWEEERARRGIGDSPVYCCKPNGLTLIGSNIWKWYREDVRPLGAPEHVHDLRHSNLSKMARYMSAHDLQRWAGWNSIAMAQRYVHDDFAQLVAAVKRSENVG